MKLSKTSRDKIIEFALAAQDWGWQQDCGTGRAVDSSRKHYEESRAALETRIALLEEKNRSLRTTIKDLQLESVQGRMRRLR